MLWPRRLIPSLQKLAAFEAAARHGNFSRAGEELSLSQSAVSKQVQQLEEAFGVVLFERENRRVILTYTGKSFYTAARDLLERASVATHAVMASAGSAGTLNIAALPTFASRWLIPRLPRFQDANPRIAVNVRTTVEPFDLEESNIDVAIHYGGAEWPGAETTRLFEEIVVPVASPSYRERNALERPSDLERALLLQLATRPHAWGDWFDMLDVRFERPLQGSLFDQFSCTAAAAMAGLGVALLPRFLIEDELAARKLVVLFDKGMTSKGAYYLVVPLSKRNHGLVSRFVSWLHDETAGVDAGEGPA